MSSTDSDSDSSSSTFPQAKYDSAFSSARVRKPSAKLRAIADEQDDSALEDPKPQPKKIRVVSRNRPAKQRHDSDKRVETTDTSKPLETIKTKKRSFPQHHHPKSTGATISPTHSTTVLANASEFRGVLRCGLCGGCIRHCRTMSGCLHKFCRHCIANHMLVSSKCPDCDCKINSENQPVDDPLYDKIIRLVYPMTRTVMDGLRHTWVTLAHSAEPFSSLCAKYDVDLATLTTDSKGEKGTDGSWRHPIAASPLFPIINKLVNSSRKPTPLDSAVVQSFLSQASPSMVSTTAPSMFPETAVTYSSPFPSDDLLPTDGPTDSRAESFNHFQNIRSEDKLFSDVSFPTE